MRLIDADEILKKCNGGNCWYIPREAIEEDPTIDAEPVVYCKDCKNWTEWENGAGSCQRSGSVMWLGTDATDFCSFAERREP